MLMHPYNTVGTRRRKTNNKIGMSFFFKAVRLSTACSNLFFLWQNVNKTAKFHKQISREEFNY